MVRVGVIGLRFGARVHVPAFRVDQRCVITALAGRSAGAAAALAAELGIPQPYADWRAMIGEGAVDAVSIAVPPLEQPRIIMEAARHGVHVFCEKPLAATVSAAEQAVASVRAAGVVHAMDFIFPELPAWQRMRELVCSGAIGPVRHFAYDWHVQTFASRTNADSWKNRSHEGGGVVANFLPHVLFNIEWVLGPVAEIESFRPRDGRSASSFCDCIAYLDNRVHGTISVSTDTYLGEGHRFAIFGEAGTVAVHNATADYASGFELRLGTRQSGRVETVTGIEEPAVADGRIAPVGRIAGRFLDGIRGEGIPAPNLEDGLRIQRWLEHLSSANGS